MAIYLSKDGISFLAILQRAPISSAFPGWQNNSNLNRNNNNKCKLIQIRIIKWTFKYN